MRISALPLKALAKWGLIKSVLIFVLFSIFYFLFSIAPAHAQSSTTTSVGNPTSGYQQSTINNQQSTTYGPNLAPDVPRDQHTYVQSVVIELLSSMICQMGGIDPIRPDHRCLGVDSQTGKIGFVENGGGAIGVMGHFIAYTFTPPLSSGDYVKYLAGNFGFPKKAYAQCANPANAPNGFGFCGIKPLLNIWVEMRNIAYLLFVLLFVLIGLAIMLRVHIDPRTVMTIENQIPRIIVGILLVTFSFAIAGFLIDVMYVAIYLVGGVLVNAGNITDPNLREIATAPTPFDLINRLWPGNPDAAGIGGGFTELAAQGGGTIKNLVNNALDPTNPLNTDPGIFDIFFNVLDFLTGLIVGILAFFIILLALIYTAIRLWIILIVAYISVLLDVVFAPFWFLIGLFPGSSLGVGAWFKDMLANLAVFPTAIAMFILAKIFSDIARVAVSNSLFIPPLAGGGTGASGASTFAGIVALGFLFMTPHVLNITRNAIKAPAINYGPVFQDPGAALRATVGTGREIGATRIASQEYVPGAGGNWAQRGMRRAFGTRTFR